MLSLICLFLSAVKTKIIFPSTHVLFEGKEKIEEDIKEDYKKFPVLSYGIGKDQNEEQIKKCNIPGFTDENIQKFIGYIRSTSR